MSAGENLMMQQSQAFFCKYRKKSPADESVHLPGWFCGVFKQVYVALAGSNLGVVKVAAIAAKMSLRATVEWLLSVQPRFTFPVCWLSE